MKICFCFVVVLIKFYFWIHTYFSLFKICNYTHLFVCRGVQQWKSEVKLRQKVLYPVGSNSGCLAWQQAFLHTKPSHWPHIFVCLCVCIKTYNVCVHLFVSVPACSYMCVRTCIHKHACVCENVWCLPQLFSAFFWGDKVSHWQGRLGRLANKAGLLPFAGVMCVCILYTLYCIFLSCIFLWQIHKCGLKEWIRSQTTH